MFDNVTFDEAVDRLVSSLDSGKKCALFTPNSEIVQSCIDDSSLYPIINSAELIIPDGIGVVKAGRILSTPFKGGKVEEQIVSTASLPKTILALAGVDVGDKMIGENLADVVAGNTPNRVNEAFAQISESRCGRCIRTPDFLYAVYAPGVNGGEAAAADVYADDYLYDLRVDPVQLNNVVADPAYAEAKAMLRGRLLDWIKRAEGAEPTIVD